MRWILTAVLSVLAVGQAIAGVQVPGDTQGKAHDHDASEAQFGSFSTTANGHWLIFYIQGELVWCEWQGVELGVYVVVGGPYDGVEFEAFSPGTHGGDYDFGSDGPVENGHLKVVAAPTSP